MEKSLLKQVIKEGQEFRLPEIVPREIEIPLRPKKLVAIYGPRHSGKTFLLYYLMKKLVARKVEKKRFLYCNFDDPRLLPFKTLDLELLLESFFEMYPELRDTENFVFFDEVQNVENWEVGVRRIYDTGNFRVFITGSSSKFLSKEIATALRGRAIGFQVLPFSFREFLLAREIKLKKDVFYSKERFAVKRNLGEYLEMGGFPEVVLEKEKDIKVRILKEYLETMFFRDLIERFKIKNQSVLRELVRYLVSNTSKLFSLNAFWRWIKQTYPVGKRTVLNYTSYLEDIGLIFLARKFSYSLKEQSQTPRKAYLLDNGLRTVYGFKFSEDKGRILENTVFLELLHRQTKDILLEVFYWQDRQKREVDFVLKKGKKIEGLIQVCAKVNDFNTKRRETNALIKASEVLKCDNLFVVTFDYEGEEKYRGKKVKFLPLWKWLIL